MAAKYDEAINLSDDGAWVRRVGVTVQEYANKRLNIVLYGPKGGVRGAALLTADEARAFARLLEQAAEKVVR